MKLITQVTSDNKTKPCSSASYSACHIDTRFMKLILQYLFIATTLIHLSHGQTLRYVMDDDNDLDRFFAFPIDQCIKVSIIESKFVKYTCSDLSVGHRVEKRLYDGEDCGTIIAGQTVEYWTARSI
eukprot:1111726_1